MFARLAIQYITLAVLAIAAAASPVAIRESNHRSFNQWGGFHSLENFDRFYGAENFSHRRFDQTIVNERHLVCHTQTVEVIQQRLVVLQEMAKRIITETICDVETQTIVFSQYHASLGNFHDDLRRRSSHRVGFDEKIVGKYGEIIGADGSLSTHDFGFTGSDVGKNVVVAEGSNWNDETSPKSVDSAYFAAQGAQSEEQD